MWIFIKRLIFKSYVIFLMAFTVWYGHFMYPLIFGFESKEEAAQSLLKGNGDRTPGEQLFAKLIVETEKTSTIDLGYRVIEQPYIEGRFHNIGFEIDHDKASTCIRCHGDVPHDQSREVRSFLNMHAFYLACETCHIRPENGSPPLDFRWYDKETALLAPNPPMLVEIKKQYRNLDDYKKVYVTYGNYGVKIAPGRLVGTTFEFLNGEKMMGFVEKYLQKEQELTPAQKSQIKQVIHEKVNKEPLECDNCHNAKQQYIPFGKLGYPPRRVDELTTTATVGMIKKYKQFWIPSLLTPGKKHDK